MAAAVVAANGMSRAINVLHKDARYIKPAAAASVATGATPASASQPADLLVFEVRSCWAALLTLAFGAQL